MNDKLVWCSPHSVALNYSPVYPNTLWASLPFLSCMPQTGIASLVYRCVAQCGKTIHTRTISHHITVPSFPQKVQYTSERKWKSVIPLYFSYMAHLVIRVARTLITSSCNLAPFHISVKPYKALIVQSRLQSYITALSFQSGNVMEFSKIRPPC